jgi:hypothetical protein
MLTHLQFFCLIRVKLATIHVLLIVIELFYFYDQILLMLIQP